MKYELVKTDTKQIGDVTLYRIRALVDIGDAKAGDLGGYIEKEANLAQYGTAWVHDSAQVFGAAKVYGEAWISGGAHVFGEAWIFGTALISGNSCVSGSAVVCGCANVSGTAKVYGNASVSGSACVYGSARVSGSARVAGTASVFGSAQVFGTARVYGSAKVSGNAHVSGDANVANNSSWLSIGPAKSSGRFTTAFIDSKIGVRVVCGCFTGPVQEFSQQIEKTHEHNKEALEQYRLFCQLITANFVVAEYPMTQM